MLSINACARTFIDDMEALDADNIKQYHNLAYRSLRGGLAPGMTDGTMFTFANLAAPYAWAQYRVTGCTGVTVGIFTPTGTFVTPVHDEPGRYALGLTPGNAPYVAVKAAPQALLCPATNTIYANLGGMKQVFMENGSGYFFPVSTPISGETMNYGVNICFSLNGTAFQYAAASRSKLVAAQDETWCYEEYTAYVPSAATHVRAEINDVTKITRADGSVMLKETPARYVALTSVTLTGEALYMGEPEPLEQMPSPGLYGNFIIIGGSSEKQSGAQTAPPAPEKEQSSSKAKSSSSKFEGTITSPQPSSKTQRPKQKMSSEAAEPKPESPPPESEGADERGETIVYEVARGEQDKRFDTGVTAYIVAVVGAIALVVVLPKRK